MNWERFAVVGTAESWKQTPWDDPNLTIASLNDAYLNGIPRADAWYELHPTEKFFYRDPKQKVIDPATIPPGAYVRPHGHLEWLRKSASQIPVWLQKEPPEGWPPHAQRFPIEAVEQWLHGYIASAPSMMIAHAVLNGCQELHVYGIHLATEQEYVDQRPNFEAVLGRFLGAGTPSMTVKDGCRRYTGENGHILVIPEASPILTHGRRYAYDPKPIPDPGRAALKVRRNQLQEEQIALVSKLLGRKWYTPTAADFARLARVEAEYADVTEQIQRWPVANSSTPRYLVPAA
jgi:hypothetical protein